MQKKDKKSESKESKELKRQERKALMEEAMKDPLFVKDIEEVERDFRYADAESAADLDKWDRDGSLHSPDAEDD